MYVGFLGLPDKSRGCSLNKLAAKCRVCQVFIGGESPENSRALIRHAIRTGVSHRLTGVYERKLRCNSGDRRRHPLDELPKFLARPEVGNLLWRNFDSCSGFRIACNAASSLANVEAPESANLNLSPRTIEDQLHDDCRSLSGISNTSATSSIRSVLVSFDSFVFPSGDSPSDCGGMG